MAIEGVDYAGSRPDPAGLYRAGKRFVVRYGGPGGSWKHLTASEAQALSAAGLTLVANAEGTASGLQGRQAGIDWARSADSHFRSLGMPASKPIYLSADWDVTSAQWPKVADALRGAASVIGAGRVGVYGSYDVMQWAKRDGVAKWFWQTYAWSGGRWASHNHIEQYNNGETVAGGSVDLCRAKVSDYGQWTLREEQDMQADERQWLKDLHGALCAPHEWGANRSTAQMLTDMGWAWLYGKPGVQTTWFAGQFKAVLDAIRLIPGIDAARVDEIEAQLVEAVRQANATAVADAMQAGADAARAS